MRVGERIRMWRKKSGLNLKDLSGKIKISQGSLSDIENNNTYPSFATIRNFCLHTAINLEWLISGEGEMFDESEPIPATGVDKEKCGDGKRNAGDSYAFQISSDVFQVITAMGKVPGSGFSPGDLLGMTKRDFFGLVAMHATLSNPTLHKEILKRETKNKKIHEHSFAHVVFEHVDQTLKKLGEQQPES